MLNKLFFRKSIFKM